MATVVRRYNTTRNGQTGVVTEYDDGSESFSWSQETVNNVQTNSAGQPTAAAETYVERKSTVYKDTAESLAIKDSKDRLQAERAAYRETLKDMGYSNREILTDPTMREYKELERTYNADYLAARQVDQLGGSYKVTTDEFGNEISRETLSQAVPPEPRSPTYNYVNYPDNDPQISDQETVSSTSIPATPSYGPQATSNVAPDDEIAIGFEDETIPESAQLDSSNYAAEQRAAVEAQLAQRQSEIDGTAMTDEEYGYYANPADDPNLFYDDSLGEYVPRTDRPEDWQTRDQNEFVYNDDTGEWVRRDEMPDNWNYGTEPVADVQRDSFGCIIGVEEYDDDSGTCIPIGGIADQGTNAQPEPLNQYGCVAGKEYYDADQGVCVPFGAHEQQAWENGCDVNSEYWDPDALMCISKEEGPPRLESEIVDNEYDENGCIIGQEYYDWDNDSCVPYDDTMKTALAHGCDPETEYWDEENLVCAPRPENAVDPAVEAAQLKPKSIYEKRRPIDPTDWRLRARLSPFATYLYNHPKAKQGILKPIAETDGVIFPYTPKITYNAAANYVENNLTHSNIKHYFYSGSVVNDILINAPFTAQDTKEAEYLLGVMHFFKACTKMFYGQDQMRGTPPPLLYLTGFGEYQFNEHPVVLSYFNYQMPDDVDYIATNIGPVTNKEWIGKNQESAGYQSWDSKLTRLITSQLDKGAPPMLEDIPVDFKDVTKTQNGVTYVPTRISLDLTFKPVQTRKQTSEEFSLEKWATGELLKKGFW